MNKTNCNESQAKKYLKKYGSVNKAIEMIGLHKVLVD